MGKSKTILVQSLADLPTPVANVITLADSQSYQFQGTVALGINYIVCGTNNTLFGNNKALDGITYTGTGGAIRSTDKSVRLRNMLVTAATVGGSAFAIVGSVGQTRNLEIVDCIIDGCNSIGSIATGFNKIELRCNIFRNNAGGLAVTDSNEDVFITDNILETFTGTPTFLSFGTATYHTLIIGRNILEVAVGQTGMSFGTITYSSGGIFQGNSFEGVGTKLSGANFLTPGLSLSNNAGILNTISYLPRAAERRNIIMSATNATFTISGHAMTISGSTLTANADNTTNYTQVTGAAPAASVAGVVSTVYTEIRSDQSPACDWVMKTGADITSLRFWLGFTSAVPTNADDLTGSYAAFRYSTSAGDTGWVPIVDNGTTNTTGTAIGTVVANTQYKLDVVVDFANTKTYFRVTVDGGTPSAWQTLANVPLSGSGLGLSGVVVGSSKIINIARMDCNTN